jgi:hypothetical protein
MSDPIGQLLRDADAALPSPAAPEGLALRVRHRRDRRRRVMRMAMGVAVIVIVSLATLPSVISRHAIRNRVAITTAPVPPAHTTSLAELDLAARLHEQTAAMLMDRSSASRPKPPHANGVVDPRTQRDRVALILVYEADRSAREKRPAEAAAAYRRAIALFPHSPWAQVARQRLKESAPDKEDHRS